jgi:hypothetical protein
MYSKDRASPISTKPNQTKILTPKTPPPSIKPLKTNKIIIKSEILPQLSEIFTQLSEIFTQLSEIFAQLSEIFVQLFEIFAHLFEIFAHLSEIFFISKITSCVLLYYWHKNWKKIF